MIRLIETKRTEPNLLKRMKNHYSKPKGFVGRSIAYAVLVEDDYYGHIIGGSSCLHLPNRDEYLNFTNRNADLNRVVNNIFYNVSKVYDKYPTRNFTTKVLLEFERRVVEDWFTKYKDDVIGLETLVEPPRTGELYLKAGWEHIGTTKGITCKRVGGLDQTEKWGGTRVWNRTDLRPKLVFCKRVE